MIYLKNLSSEDRKAIEELQNRMKNDLPKHMLEDKILSYRFLKARDFNIEDAEAMFRKHIIWRRHFQIDSIMEEFTPRPFFEKYIKLRDLGMDKNGNMLMYIPLGNLDARDILQCVQINEYMKHWVWHFEEVGLKEKKLNEKIDQGAVQITMIMNMDKLTLSNATSRSSIEVCVRALHLLQDNYPECLNAVYAINSPGYYVFIYSILKAMMSNALIQKIHVYSKSGWQAKLLEVIDADVLPKFLGGNRTDPDGNPMCNTIVTHGGKVPKKYYLPEKEREFRNKSLVKRITIPPKQKKEVAVQTTQIGSRINWEFLIKNKDIGFGLFYKVSESDSKEILPIEKYDTIDGVEKGSYRTQSSGNYVIVFDNSYSWMNSKEIDYCITVT